MTGTVLWIHPTDPSQSLFIGTDKNPEDGALYVFDLDGKILPEKTVRPLLRVNNAFIESFNGRFRDECLSQTS